MVCLARSLAAIVVFAVATPVAVSASPPSPVPEAAPPLTSGDGADVIATDVDRARRMTVPVRIGGAGPYPFVVDTGSERTVLSEELAGQLGLSPTGVAEIHSVSGPGRVETVSVADLAVSRTVARDLTAPLLKRQHLGAEGILGIDSLQENSVLLDFRAHTMTVTQSRRRPVSKVDDDTIVIKAHNRLGRLILGDAAINGRRVAIVIDTGAQYSIGNALLRKRVVGNRPDAFIVPTTIYSVTGGEVPAEVTTVRSMRLGNLTLTDMPIAFADLSIFERLGLDKRPAMLLGMNTMRAFERVSVDFANRQVLFEIPGESRLDSETRLAALDR